MNGLSPHGQRAELQQEQLCSEKTAETEAAAPATHTQTRLVMLRPQDALTRVSWNRHLRTDLVKSDWM